MPELEGKTREKDIEKPEKPNKRSRSFLNKVVIRKLPPNLTEESFIEIVSPLPDYFDLYFCPADWSLGAEATSRAYIEFKNEEDIFIFRDKFDSYVFVDSVRGSEYPAIVEYASFQGLPKSRSRKRDKNVGTIESEQHYLDFLEQLKKEEETDLKNEPKLEFSYKLKDDKKITLTPLIEFLAAKNREKRDARRKKTDDKRKQQQEDKQKKKIQVARNIPESIKETKEEVLYEDGIMVRTVPSRSGRSDKKKDSKADARPEAKPKSENSERNAERDQERRERREKEKSERRKLNKEKEEKRKADRAVEREKQIAMAQKAQKDPESKTLPGSSEKIEKSEKPKAEQKSESRQANRDKNSNREAPAKSETKRYSALRKARQEKTSESKDAAPETQQEEGEEKMKPVQKAPAGKERSDAKPDVPTDEQVKADAAKKEAQKEARLKRAQENKERRAREADERVQRQIRNRDRPSMQIYQPKRRNENNCGSENVKSSDENSETSRKKSDNELKKSDTERKTEKRERRHDKRSSRKNSRDETRKKKTSRSEDDVEKFTGDGTSATRAADENEGKTETIVEKLGSLALKASKSKKPEVVRGNVNTITPAAPKDIPAAEDVAVHPSE